MGFKAAHHQRSLTCASTVSNGRSPSSRRSQAPAYRLQQGLGNSATSRLFNGFLQPKRLLRPVTIQPKLTISEPGDEYEREADRVADQVMRMPDRRERGTLRPGGPGVVQRKCACNGKGGDCTGCREKSESSLQRTVSNHVEPENVASNVHEVLRSPGQALDQSTRTFFEPRFGRDLSQVRLHSDSNTADFAGQINARAFTIGNDIGFAKGQYQPTTMQGQRLLAHELTHVVQQNGQENVSTIQRDPDRFCPNGDVNDATVQAHINAGLAFGTTRGSTDLQLAFAHLRQARERNCCDLNLAAAEHYMYARLQVATGSWSFFEIMFVIGYSFLKFLHLIPRTGDCPITRASAAQIRWASAGAVDGEMDYYSTPP